MPIDTPDPAARAHAIFSRALALEPPQRDDFLKDACEDDPTTLARVRKLLAAAERSTGFLESPALPRPAELPIPDAVGSYLVVSVLGSGGMATVYEAVQENPHRRVAIKVMRNSLAHSSALLRFQLEARALARLHHPGIAQIHEAGTARLSDNPAAPFFAMELVPDALPITRYANVHNLSLRERLAMFASVCDAVLHGHQNGIIHRDLKPANVLVGSDGAPKVIDFGIARITDTDAPVLTAESDTTRLIGTLQSMSPEQCLEPTSVDARSDVYSLGVILYELVTDSLPYDLTRASIPEAVRIITEQSPPRPSAFCPEARGDLDAIIQTAMDKDRSCRYPGADALAADIRKYLDNRPIDARRASVLDHMQKFARRNPPLALALVAATLLLIISATVSTYLASAAAAARDASLRREKDLEAISLFQESMLRDIDTVAMGKRLRASITASLQGSDPDDPARAPDLEHWDHLASQLNFTSLAVQSLNTSILQRYAQAINDRFADQPALRARLLHQLAATMNSLGLFPDALPLISLAWELRRDTLGEDHTDTLQSRHALGSLLTSLSRYNDALPHLVFAYEHYKFRLGPDDPSTLNAATTLGGLYRWKGDLPQAESIWTDTLARQRRVLGDDHPSTLRTLNNMGVLYAVQGKLDLAEAAWREFVERKRRAAEPQGPDIRGSLANLGVLLQDQGRLAEAEPILREALDADRHNLGDDNPPTLVTMSMLASLLRELGNLEEAESLQRECASRRAIVLGSTHRDTLRSNSMLGLILSERGHIADGEALIRAALDAQLRASPDHKRDAIESLGFLRDIARSDNRLPDALEHSSRLLTLAREPRPIQPVDLAPQLSGHGELLLALHRLDEARWPLEEAHAILNASVGPNHPLTRAAARRFADYFAELDKLHPDSDARANEAAWRRRADPQPPPRE